MQTGPFGRAQRFAWHVRNGLRRTQVRDV